MSTREPRTYMLTPPASIDAVMNPHTFDMQSDICTKCGAMATELEDSIVSLECHVTHA